jgi:hypothetical protein
MFEVNGFFAPYAYLGMMYFALLMLIGLAGGIMLSKIFKRWWIFIVVLIIDFFIFYIFDLGLSSILITVFAVAVGYFYIFNKMKNKPNNPLKNSQKNEKK